MTLSELIAQWRKDEWWIGVETCANELEEWQARLMELRDRWVGEAERLRQMAVLDVSVVRIQANQYQARADELSALIGEQKGVGGC